jgi:hypothetical protein
MLNLIQTSRKRAIKVKDTHKSPKDKPGSRPLAVPEKPQQFPIRAMSPRHAHGATRTDCP